IEDELGTQGAKVAGQEWKAGYDSAKHGYRMAKTVRDTTDKALDRIGGNRTFSLTDNIQGAAGAAAGFAAAGPAGALLGLGAAAANKA
ncbi:hypothetical protein U2044_15425, partial [Listeria monocytogenes]|uniref:hypothetical protein n=1 Tax=Listeria monocytogenes TaxID=1639 RepID=UPI002FDC1527